MLLMTFTIPMRRYVLLLWLTLPMLVFGQNGQAFWQSVSHRPTQAPLNPTSASRVMTADVSALRQYLHSSTDPSQAVTLALPQADGSFARFEIVPSDILPPDLAARYPMIQTYQGQGIDEPTARLRLTIGSRGINAYLWSEQGDQVIEPYQINTPSTYQVYALDAVELHHEGPICGVDADHLPELTRYRAMRTREEANHSPATRNGSGADLYTYRLAISADFQYSEAVSNGPANVPDVLSAITTIVNQLSEVYEREVAVSFNLVSQQDQLIFLDAASDPFSVNGEPIAQITENPAIIDGIIGINAYDVGHVFTRRSSNGGVLGVGYFQAVCSEGVGQNLSDPHKANGASGNTQPLSPFFNFLVYHEVGHQFDANHAFDYCNPGGRDGTAAYEPGSGSTIMSYAGICQFNLQSLADAYFNSGNYDQVYNFTRNLSTCASITQTGNSAPSVAPTLSGTILPISTPFELTAIGSDPDGDAITYCWEQHDLGPGSPPNNPVGNAPLFRSFPPTSHPTRTFPQLQNLINGTTTIGEVLPTYTRGMRFRITARDQRLGGGGVTHNEAFFNVTDQAGPFQVLAPNQAVVLTEGDILPVTWDPANTQVAPVDCDSVMILLSSDGGFTYPDTLVPGTPNDGAHDIFVPNSIGPGHRLKIRSIGNVFFDISDQNFTIEAAAFPDVNLLAERDTVTLCPNSQTTLRLFTAGQGGFSGLLSLTSNAPSGVSVSFSPTTPVAGDTVLVTLVGGSSLSAATQVLGFLAQGAGVNGFTNLVLNTLSSVPEVPTLDVAATGTLGLSLTPTLTWQPTIGGLGYQLQVGTSPSFSTGTLIVDESGLSQSFFVVGTPLVPGGIYYWRVRAETQCGVSEYSAVGAFEVGDCSLYPASDLPAVLPPFGAVPLTVSSTITVNDPGAISDVNVIGLRGTHDDISELTVALTKDAGPEIVLFSGVCGPGSQAFNLSLDDEATPGSLPCPPNTGEAFQPEGALSTLYGSPIAGDYTLTITDSVNFGGGEWQNWSLEICTESPDRPAILTDTLLVASGQQATAGNDVLQVTDPSFGPGDLILTLVATPSTGTLSLSGTALVAGDIFTQADIDNGLLSYAHDGSADSVDAFVVGAENPGGGWSGLGTVSVRITSQVGLADGPLAALRVFPNPTQGQLRVTWEGEPQPLRVSLFNLQGQALQAQTTDRASLSLDLSGYAVGLYLLRVQVGDQQRSLRVMIE